MALGALFPNPSCSESRRKVGSVTRHNPKLAAKLYARPDENPAPSKADEIIEMARRVHTGEVSFSEWSVFVTDQLKKSDIQAAGTG